MKSYIYKIINEHSDKEDNKRIQIPVYAWRDPLERQFEDSADKGADEAAEKRGYEELDFNIDSFIVDN